MSQENESAGRRDMPDSDNDPFLPNNVVSMSDYLDREISRRAGHHQRSKEGELVVRVKDKLEQHKTITVVGTAAAIGLALGGLYAIRKKRQR